MTDIFLLALALVLRYKSPFPDKKDRHPPARPRYEPLVEKRIWKVKKMAGKSSPTEYVRQVKAEMQKVTWPSRKETTTSTVAVFIMVTLVSIFLFLADQFMAFIVRLILGLGM